MAKQKDTYHHDTAVEDGDHLSQWLAYIELNMKRAGDVSHPAQWIYSDYNEIQEPKREKKLKLESHFNFKRS